MYFSRNITNKSVGKPNRKHDQHFKSDKKNDTHFQSFVHVQDFNMVEDVKK